MRGLVHLPGAHILVGLILAASVIQATPAAASDAFPREVTGPYSTLVENASYFVGISRAGAFTINVTYGSTSFPIEVNPQSITIQWLGATGSTTFDFPELGAFLLANSVMLNCERSARVDVSVDGPTAFAVNMLELTLAGMACRVQVAGEADVQAYDYRLHLASAAPDVTMSGADSHAFVLVLTPRGGPSSVSVTLTPVATGSATPWLVGAMIMGTVVLAATVVVWTWRERERRRSQRAKRNQRSRR